MSTQAELIQNNQTTDVVETHAEVPVTEEAREETRAVNDAAQVHREPHMDTIGERPDDGIPEHIQEEIPLPEETPIEARDDFEREIEHDNIQPEEGVELEEHLQEVATAHGHNIAQFEQIAIEFEPVRQREASEKAEAAQTQEDEGTRTVEETQELPQAAARPQEEIQETEQPKARKPAVTSEQEVLPREPFPHKFNRGQEPEKTGGEVHIDYTFERFNASGEYAQVTNALTLLQQKMDYKRLFGMGTEAVYEHKGDGSKITIRQDAVICDNTPGNLSAALDIAEDKGWDVIKITGGSRAAKAELWFQAKMRGFDTRGYSPNQMDMKRLLGAQERQHKAQEAEATEQANALTEALDITPRTAPEKERPAEQKATTPTKPIAEEEKVTQMAEDRPNVQAVSSTAIQEKGEGKVTNTAVPEQDTTLTADQRFERMAKEIMTEVSKYYPLNTEEYQNIEEVVNKQIAAAYKMGKKMDMDKIKKDIQKGMPYLRQELESAGQAEQRQVKRDQELEKSKQAPIERPELRTRKERSRGDNVR